MAVSLPPQLFFRANTPQYFNDRYMNERIIQGLSRINMPLHALRHKRGIILLNVVPALLSACLINETTEQISDKFSTVI
jgi:hypothetical protein